MKDTVKCLSQAPYRFAKTMPNDPHYYTLLSEWDGSGSASFLTLESWAMVAKVLWANTVRRKYVSPVGKQRWQKYMDANGYQYWSMDRSAETTDLINRAPKFYPDAEAYDRVALAYDGLFRNSDETRISRKWFGSIPIRSGMRILDVGCGTGELVDYRYKDIVVSNYVGIDPSLGMLGVFAAKHPDYRTRLVRTTFEDFVDAKWTRAEPGFDLITAMFGVASYVPDIEELVRKHLRPGGLARLMWYVQGTAKWVYDLYGQEKPGGLLNAPDDSVVEGQFGVKEIKA